MAWEARSKGSERYFYKARRIAGRVVKTYLGRSDQAEAAAAQVAAAQQARAAERDAVAAAVASLEPLDEATAELDRRADDAAEAVLLQAGYHFHRGEWRRRHA